MPGGWDEAPVGLLTTDLDGALLAANGTLLRWLGAAREDVVGRRRLPELLTAAGRIYWETHLSPLLHVEGVVEEVAVQLVVPSGRLPVLLSARTGPPGAAPHVHVALTPARERADYERQLRAARAEAEAAAARVSALHQVTAALSGAVGSAAVARAVTTSAVVTLGAARATLWRHDAGRPAVVADLGGSGHREGPAPAGPPPPPPPPGRAGRAAQAAPDGSGVVVALRGHAALHGVLVLVPSAAPGGDPLDLDAVTALAQQAGLALDRAATYERSATIAHELQRSLLAGPVPADPRFAVATAYRPGVEALDVGGDWYDVFDTGGGVLSVVVGDVIGRGLPAASAMGQLRSAVRAVADPRLAPSAALERLDRFVDQVPAAELATVAHAQLDLASGLVRHSSAGHPPPLHLPVGGPPRLLWGGRSTPLGSVVAHRRTDAAVQLRPGDRLLLCTDGLVERRGRSLEHGLRELQEEAAALGDLPLPEAVAALTRALLRDGTTRDDVCVLLLQWHGPGRPGGAARDR